MVYDWPGNVRELRNMVERLVIMTPGDVIEPEDLPPFRSREAVAVPTAGSRACARRATPSSARTSWASCAPEWNITRTAQALGIGRVNLWRKLKAYGIAAPGRARTPPRSDA